MYKKIQSSKHGQIDMRMLISTDVKISFHNEFLELPEVELTGLFSGEELDNLEQTILTEY